MSATNGSGPSYLGEPIATISQCVNIGLELRARLAAVAADHQRDVTAEARHVLREHVTQHERETEHGKPQRT